MTSLDSVPRRTKVNMGVFRTGRAAPRLTTDNASRPREGCLPSIMALTILQYTTGRHPELAPEVLRSVTHLTALAGAGLGVPCPTARRPSVRLYTPPSSVLSICRAAGLGQPIDDRAAIPLLKGTLAFLFPSRISSRHHRQSSAISHHFSTRISYSVR